MEHLSTAFLLVDGAFQCLYLAANPPDGIEKSFFLTS
jgi:hypothetical protein